MVPMAIEWDKGKLLAKNSFGETWKARQGNEDLIIKLVDPGDTGLTCSSLDAQIEISKKELSAEDQKSIVLFTAKGELHKGKISYSRPFIEGEVLSDRIKKESFIEQKEAAEIILKIARIVAYAHKHGLIHGDLKPENIIRKEDGSYCIIDWETMRIDKAMLTAKSSMGKTLSADEAAGTAEYMSPQLHQDDRLTPQDDVYALGIIFHEMLTGKTPFDEWKGKRGKIANVKSEGDPKSISEKFPERHIDSRFDEIYQKATKKALLDRFQSVDEFIEKLEYSLRKQNSSDTTVTPTPVEPQNNPQTQSNDNAADDSKNIHLVLVGPDGAGKTVLAAALCAASDDQFSFTPKDEETRVFVRNTQTSLVKGYWPAGTKDEKAKHLYFEIAQKGKGEKATIVFDDYNGEDLKFSPETFCKRSLQHADGVLFLLNPGIVQDEASTRKDKIDAIIKAITVLSKKTAPPPMALVITASDRLETDLKEKKEDFDSYKKQILNCAQTRLPADKFPIFSDISVTGNLEKQGDPGENIPFFLPKGEKLKWEKAQKVKEPFLWILSKLDERKKQTARMSWLKWVKLIPVLVLLGFAALFCVELKYNSDLETKIKEAQKKWNGKIDEVDLRKGVKALAEVRRSQCQLNHITEEGSRIAACSTSCRPSFFYPCEGEVFDAQINGLEQQIDEKNNEKFTACLNAINLQQFDEKNHLKKIDKIKKDIKGWKPLKKANYKNKTDLIRRSESIHEEILFKHILYQLDKVIKDYKKNEKLLFDVEKLLPDIPKQTHLEVPKRQEQNGRLKEKLAAARSLVFTAISESLENELSAVIREPRKKSLPPDYKTRYENLNLLVKKGYSDDGKKILARLDELYRSANEAVFLLQVSDRINDIEKSSDNVDELARIIREFNNFFAVKQYEVFDKLFSEKKKSVESKLKEKIMGYIEKSCKVFETKQMKSYEFDKKPAFKSDIENKIFPEIKNQVMLSELQGVLTQRLGAIKKKWDDARKAAVKGFIAKYENVALDEIIRGLNDFLQQNNFLESHNPYLGEIEDFALKKLYEYAGNFIQKVRRQNGRRKTFRATDFSKMKQIWVSLSKINKSHYSKIRKDPIFDWYKRYHAWKHDNPSFHVSFGELAVKVESPKYELFISQFFYKGKDDQINFTCGRFNLYYLQKFKSSQYEPFTKGRKYWPPKPHVFSIGDKIEFHADLWDTHGNDHHEADVSFVYYPGVDEIPKAIEVSDKDKKVTVKMGIIVRGQSFESWLKKNPFPPKRKGK